MLSKKQLQRGLTTKFIGRKLFVFESIDSTNACAKTLAEAGCEEGTVVLADYQSQGRGRLGRTWLAEPGQNLLFSIVLRPSIPQSQSPVLTFLSAVAVSRAVEKVTGVPTHCKWPNDVLLNKKKVCGILTESSLTNGSVAYSVVGIGLNVNQQKFSDSIKDATSVALELGKECDRKALFHNVLCEFEELYEALLSGKHESILDEWNRRCSMFGHTVTVSTHDSQISGTAKRLNDDGGLVLSTNSGEQTFYAGDVTIISS